MLNRACDFDPSVCAVTFSGDTKASINCTGKLFDVEFAPPATTVLNSTVRDACMDGAMRFVCISRGSLLTGEYDNKMLLGEGSIDCGTARVVKRASSSSAKGMILSAGLLLLAFVPAAFAQTNCNNGMGRYKMFTNSGGDSVDVGTFPITERLIDWAWGSFGEYGGDNDGSFFTDIYTRAGGLVGSDTCGYKSTTVTFSSRGQWGPAWDIHVSGWDMRQIYLGMAKAQLEQLIDKAGRYRCWKRVEVDCSGNHASAQEPDVAGLPDKADPKSATTSPLPSPLASAGNATLVKRAPGACTCTAVEPATCHRIPGRIKVGLWDNCIGANAGSLEFTISGFKELFGSDSACGIWGKVGFAASWVGGLPFKKHSFGWRKRCLQPLNPMNSLCTNHACPFPHCSKYIPGPLKPPLSSTWPYL